jgi:hypothetical protein
MSMTKKNRDFLRGGNVKETKIKMDGAPQFL